MAEYHFRDVDSFRLVDLYRDAAAIIPYADKVVRLVDVHLDAIHGLVFLVVVCRVHENLIKDFV